MIVNVRPETMQDWRLLFGGIYGEHDRQLYSTHDIKDHVWEQKSKVSKCIRKEDGAELSIQLPVLFAWLIRLWEDIGLDIEEAAWFKYPNICPACFKKERCPCIVEGLKYDPEDSRLARFRRDRRSMPHRLSGWQATGRRIYGKVNNIMTIEKVWLHLDEELGEMSIELRHRNQGEITDKLKEESGDVFLWGLNFCTRVGVDLDEVLWQTYTGKCNVCHEEKCICPYD